jgi:hypothetical protein
MQLMPFQRGQSGNPLGRPPGARNKATIIAEALLHGEAEALMRVAIERAKAGDMTALRMCLDRLAPAGRHRTIEFELPPLRTAADAAEALADITAGVAMGELAPANAGELFKCVEGFARLREATIFEQRVAKLERVASKLGLKNDQNNQSNQDDRGNQNDQVSQISQISQNEHGAEP